MTAQAVLSTPPRHWSDARHVATLMRAPVTHATGSISTPTLALAAYITAITGIEPHIERRGGRGRFVFPNGAEVQAALRQWRTGRTMADPDTYCRVWDRLAAQVGQRRRPCRV